MNFWAKVPVIGVEARADPRLELVLSRDPMPSSAKDWCREWATAGVGDIGIDIGITVDLDLACPGGGPGEGEPLALPNGLFRNRGPDWAWDAIV